MLRRTAHRISVAAGIAILALVAYSSSLPVVKACGELNANYDLIIAFELARSANDLQAIFGAAPDGCRARVAARMNFVNVIDCAIYIPLYGAFLAFFLLGLRSLNPQIAVRAAALVVVACVADYAENICLFKLTADPSLSLGTSPLTSLAWFTEVKWIGLGAAGAIGGYLLSKRGGPWRLAVIPCTLGVIASLISIPAPSLIGPYLSLAFACGWLLFLIVDGHEFLSSRLENKESAVD